jgi:uncharacterized protein
MDNTFVGIGWAFPPAFYKDGKTVVMARGEEDINQSLYILLSTSIGERVMQPKFGCNLSNFQFETMTSSLISFLKDLVENAILYYEARIEVKQIEITPPQSFDLIEGKIIISIDYIILGTNSRYNYVYDFYLREANNQIT